MLLQINGIRGSGWIFRVSASLNADGPTNPYRHSSNMTALKIISFGSLETIWMVTGDTDAWSCLSYQWGYQIFESICQIQVETFCVTNVPCSRGTNDEQISLLTSWGLRCSGQHRRWSCTHILWWKLQQKTCYWGTCVVWQKGCYWRIWLSWGNLSLTMWQLFQAPKEGFRLTRSRREQSSGNRERSRGLSISGDWNQHVWSKGVERLSPWWGGRPNKDQVLPSFGGYIRELDFILSNKKPLRSLEVDHLKTTCSDVHF